MRDIRCTDVIRRTQKVVRPRLNESGLRIRPAMLSMHPMPLIHVTSNLVLTDAEKANCLHTLSQAVAELLGKSEKYVMTIWTTGRMTMGGDAAPALFVELRGIRLPEDAAETLTPELCERLRLTTDVQADRIYLNFQDVPPGQWGWNGKTFG